MVVWASKSEEVEVGGGLLVVLGSRFGGREGGGGWAIGSSEREATGVGGVVWVRGSNERRLVANRSSEGGDLMNRRLLGGTMMVWVKRSNKGRLVVVLVSGSSEGRSVVLDAYWTQWVWKIYPLKEEDKNAFGMTQSKELATLLEAEKISCGKSEVDFIVSFFMFWTLIVANGYGKSTILKKKIRKLLEQRNIA
ncbi:hypothetical protein JHK85_012616 [Glycine max]|nr:hypothetical protein JHK85_012616 [Glycine max]